MNYLSFQQGQVSERIAARVVGAAIMLKNCEQREHSDDSFSEFEVGGKAFKLVVGTVVSNLGELVNYDHLDVAQNHRCDLGTKKIYDMLRVKYRYLLESAEGLTKGISFFAC